MNLIAHSPSVESDILLTGWFFQLVNEGTFDQTFRLEKSPSAFLSFFRSCPLVYAVRGAVDHIWFAAWAEPAFDGSVAWFSSWCEQEKRGSVDHVRTAYKAYTAAFRIHHTLLGVTKQAKLLDLHRKIGYTLMGEIPNAWDGAPVYMLKLTHESFLKGSIARFVLRRHG